MANMPDKWDNEGDNLIPGALPMKLTTSARKRPDAVWLVWLLVMVTLLLRPSLLSQCGTDSVASGVGVVLADMPHYELFPWWPRVRWRKQALAAYRRWRRARRQVWQRAQMARMALAGVITFATIVDRLSKWQLRAKQVAVTPPTGSPAGIVRCAGCVAGAVYHQPLQSKQATS
jgi:hypothetical protein